MLFLTSDNVLYGYGNNYYGIVGNGDAGVFRDESEVETTAIVKEPYKIMEDCTYFHYFLGSPIACAVNSAGELYAWGLSSSGQIEFGKGTQKRDSVDYSQYVTASPKLLMDGVSKAYIGSGVMFAIKTDGSLWGWGYADTGLTGTGYYAPDDPEREGYNILCTADMMVPPVGDKKYIEPTKVMDDVELLLCNDYSDVFIARKTDGSLWRWGADYAFYNKEEGTARGIYLTSGGVYVDWKYIPTPQPFDVKTFTTQD